MRGTCAVRGPVFLFCFVWCGFQVSGDLALSHLSFSSILLYFIYFSISLLLHFPLLSLSITACKATISFFGTPLLEDLLAQFHLILDGGWVGSPSRVGAVGAGTACILQAK